VSCDPQVDLVEPDARFLDKAKQQLGPLQPLNGHRCAPLTVVHSLSLVCFTPLGGSSFDSTRRVVGSRVEGFFYEGLQSFAPAKQHYDLVWIQWVIGYLTDGTPLFFVATIRACTRDSH